jgi:putative DNA primase/helicase
MEVVDLNKYRAALLVKRSEEGVADMFVNMFVEDVRYETDRKWLLWTGSHWQEDKDDSVYQRVRKVTEQLDDQARNMPRDNEKLEKQADAFARFVRSMQREHAHRSVLQIASRHPDVRVPAEKLDRPAYLLPCQNGTIDLRTGELREARREDYLTRVIPTDYDPTASAPKFEKFLERIQPELPTRLFLQRLLGYSVFGFVREHVFPIFFGDGANGKSVLASVVQHVLVDYAQTAPATLVIETKNEPHRTEVERLRGVRVAFVHETKRGVKLNVERVKMLCGGDRITANRMHHDLIEFDPTHQLVLVSNFKPHVDAALRAVWRRLLLIPFEVEIPEKDQDLGLADDISDLEAEGVLRWLVDGAAWWFWFHEQAKGGSGLLPPRVVLDHTLEYQAAEDVVGSFVEAKCVLNPNAQVQGAALYKAYREYCESVGVKPARNNDFAEAIRRVKNEDGKAVGKATKTDGVMVYASIGLHASEYADDSRGGTDEWTD